MKLSDFSIRRPVFTMVIMIVFLLLGAVSLTRIPLKLIPSISPPIGAVVATYPDAGPREVLDNVTKPLEDQLGTIPGLKDLTSTSQEGSSLIILQFTNDTDIDEIQTDIQSAIDRADLPEEVRNARFLKFDPAQFPILQLALSTTNMNDEFSGDVRDLERKLSQVKGVASVNARGLEIDVIEIKLDQEALKDHYLTERDVVTALRASNVSLPGSSVRLGDRELTTRVIAPIHSASDLKKLELRTPKGETVSMADLGSVSIVPKDDGLITRNNQKPAVLVNLLQQSDANTEQVSQSVRERLAELLEQNKYSDIEASILFDQGDLVDRAVGSLQSALILGAAFAMLVLFFFLRNLKTPLIIGISIPFSVIVTFVLIYFSGFTLNIMTLGGLALGIGMLVDNSIVVIENVYRHLNMGEEPRKAAAEGTKEVGVAITASTLTTVAVFVPVVFVTGIIGDLFKQFALTIAFSLLASLFVALTVVPMLASRMLKAPKENKERRRRQQSYMKSLGSATAWALRHRFLVLLFVVLLLAGGIFGMTKVGAEFLPQQDQGFFTIDLKLPNGTRLEKTEAATAKVEQLLADEPAVQDYFSLIGSTQNQGPQNTTDSSEAQIYVKMKEAEDRDVTTGEFVENIRAAVEEAVPGADRVTLNQQSTTGTEPNTLTFKVNSDDQQVLEEAVRKITEQVQHMDDTVEVTNGLKNTVKELQIRVDREEARQHGLTAAQVGQIVNQATRGMDVMQITNDNGRVKTVRVVYDPEVTSTADDLKELWIPTPAGKGVPLKDVADIAIGDSPVAIHRDGEERSVPFTVKFSNETTLGEFKAALAEQVEELNLDDAVSVSYTGDFDLLQNSQQQLAMAFILAIVLVYLVMAAQFESFKYPFVIMISVPLIFIGVSLALYATQTPISATVLIGLVVLAGIVVNNAIVLIDYILQLKARGYAAHDAIVESVQLRTRPILMTALTTILGLLPVAFAIGEGTEIQQPMGITVIGGLISSTFLTLFVIPVVYSFFDPETRRRKKA
ncbi:MAG TPA: efflux RND transporter permease subunit [Bacillales bacterium]|nr:efflux RND transporter permease subunit [Bacillales bacterium]